MKLTKGNMKRYQATLNSTLNYFETSASNLRQKLKTSNRERRLNKKRQRIEQLSVDGESQTKKIRP